MCTSTMDELPKKAYEKPDDLYKYKGVPIPPLEMIDDVLTVTTAEKNFKFEQNGKHICGTQKTEAVRN